MNTHNSHTTCDYRIEEHRRISNSIGILELPVTHVMRPLPHSLTTGFASRSILIVDDTPGFRHIMREGLATYGYDCEEADCGTEALAFLKQKKFDVVLTDLTMPFLDGLGLAQHLMEDASFGQPMVILMTSGHSDMVRSLAWNFGVKDIVIKPCCASDIDRIIRQEPLRFPKAA
jgi:two-component system, chemotaxis family, chemotaxis protein CheY